MTIDLLTSMTMTWVRGRELATVTKGSDTISYTYGESGLRISKTVNGVVHKYIYDGDLLISEQFGDTLLIYVYDEAGSPIGFKYRTTGYAIGAFDSYVFEKNLQGDIVAIYNTSGTAVATYKYDAWGNVISATGTMASVNPFRYRGYYYDTETGFYYLQSRYYDPAIGRFINTDSINVIGATPTALTDKNLYAYCDNNPVMRTDGDGMFWETVWDIASLIGSIIDVVNDPSDPWAWAGLVGDVVDVLIPCVGGIGEVTKVAKTVDNIVDAADDIHDAVKAVDKVDDAIDAVKTSKRSQAVRKAWRNEYLDVKNGGNGVSRIWTSSEKIELLNTGKVTGYQGHHMKSVKGYPELAGDPDNIQFLTRAEHLKAHGGNWRNITHGRYTG